MTHSMSTGTLYTVRVLGFVSLSSGTDFWGAIPVQPLHSMRRHGTRVRSKFCNMHISVSFLATTRTGPHSILGSPNPPLLSSHSSHHSVAQTLGPSQLLHWAGSFTSCVFQELVDKGWLLINDIFALNSTSMKLLKCSFVTFWMTLPLCLHKCLRSHRKSALEWILSVQQAMALPLLSNVSHGRCFPHSMIDSWRDLFHRSTQVPTESAVNGGRNFHGSTLCPHSRNWVGQAQ